MNRHHTTKTEGSYKGRSAKTKIVKRKSKSISSMLLAWFNALLIAITLLSCLTLLFNTNTNSALKPGVILIIGKIVSSLVTVH